MHRSLTNFPRRERARALTNRNGCYAYAPKSICKERSVNVSSQGWRTLYSVIKRQARALPRPRRRFAYSDALICAMFFWAVWHDRPQCWACRRDSYSGLFRPRKRPSVSEFNRRIRSPRLASLLEGVFRAFAPQPAAGGWCWLDARPLPVGPCSKDHAARAGRVYGGFARGYRVHALVAENDAVFAWKLTGLNAAEPDVALELLAHVAPGSTVLSDGVNDSARLYAAAERRQATLLARPRRNAGQGHCPQSAARLRSIARWNAAPREYTIRRAQVDRVFGWQSSFGGGPSPLPAWVRTPERVHRWVAAKPTIYHVRRHEKRCSA